MPTKVIVDCSTPGGIARVVELTPEEIAAMTPTLDQEKVAKITALAASRDAKIYGGFTSSALGAPHPYFFGDGDQTQMTQTSVGFLSDSTFATVNYLTADKGFLAHTKAQFFTLVADARAHKEGAYNRYVTLRGQVEAATTKAQVDAVTW